MPRYLCSKHGAWMINAACLGIDKSRGSFWVPFFICPIPLCQQMKPNKWVKPWSATKEEVEAWLDLKRKLANLPNRKGNGVLEIMRDTLKRPSPKD